jgi:hypothetical protein
MSVPLSEAIVQLREELRKAVLEGDNQDIIFVPEHIELELGLTFEAEAKVGGGFKFFALVDTSAEAKTSRSSDHKVKLILNAMDRQLNPLKVVSTDKTRR